MLVPALFCLFLFTIQPSWPLLFLLLSLWNVGVVGSCHEVWFSHLSVLALPACPPLSSPSSLALIACSNPLRIFCCCVALYSVDIYFIFNSRHHSVGVYFISHSMDIHLTFHTVGVCFRLTSVAMCFYTSQCGNALYITQYGYLFVFHKVKIPCHPDVAFFYTFLGKQRR